MKTMLFPIVTFATMSFGILATASAQMPASDLLLRGIPAGPRAFG